MGRPGYFTLDDPTIIEFPRAERPGSNPIIREDTDLAHETEEGVLWIYPQVRRKRWELNFRVDEERLAIFQALNDSVNGQALPFYYVPDVDVPGVNYLVRKEQGFAPKQLDERGVWDDDETALYDYTLIMREESPGSFVSA